MSTFTQTLSEIMAFHEVDSVDESLPKANILGLDRYPIFEESHRHILNRKIIARFWNREIGHETVEMFRFRMDTRMREIMVEHNQLYRSEQLKFDPLRTIDIKTVMDGTGSSTTDTTAHGESLDQVDGTKDEVSSGEADATGTKAGQGRTVSSVMPQTQLSGNGDYADSAQDSNTTAQDATHSETSGTSGETTSSTNTGTTDGTQNVQDTSQVERNSETTGYQAMPSQLLMQYRESILNIDLTILGQLETLFMSITSNGDEFFYSQDHYYSQPFYGWYY